MKFWLFKTEPDVFSIEDLEKSPNQECEWEGVRNYQARNFLRDEIKEGDGVLFYHSRLSPPRIVGIAIVSKDGYVDTYAFDRNSDYFDAKSKPENPTWYMVNIKLKYKFEKPLTLTQMRDYTELKDMSVLKKGSRLSIQPVQKTEFYFILSLYKLNFENL